MAADTTRSFYAPDGELTDELLRNLLSLISEDLPGGAGAWTPLERLVVADYALREHYRASDNPTQRRPRPSLLGPRG
jgi:hypothetical protein